MISGPTELNAWLRENERALTRYLPPDALCAIREAAMIAQDAVDAAKRLGLAGTPSETMRALNSIGKKAG